MAIKYVDDEGKHKPQERIKSFYGTEQYASLSSHMYITQSRRDDLESLLYNLVYMHTGKLPWLKLPETDKKKRISLIYEMKKNVDPNVLCKGMPKEYCIFFKYIRNLRYSDKPHYSTLLSMFRGLLAKNDAEDSIFQWCTLLEKV
jgi:casein kinase 1